MRKVLILSVLCVLLLACTKAAKPTVWMPEFEPMVPVTFLNVTDAEGDAFICMTQEEAVNLKQHEEQWILRESTYRALLKQMGAVERSR